MTFGIIYLACSIAASLGIFFLTPMHETPWTAAFIVLMIPVGYLICFLFTVIYIAFVNYVIFKPTRRSKPSKYAIWMIHETCTQILFLMGAHVKKTGMARVPKKGNFVLVCNHLSDFDQFAVLSAFAKYPMVWISKPENFKFPLIGRWIAKASYFPINRDDQIQGVKTIQEAAEFAKEGKYVVAVCPEGTRSKDHLLHEFKPGAFQLAVGSEKPLVIVALRNTYKVPKNLFKRRTQVYVDVVDSIQPEEYSTMTLNEMAARAHQSIAEWIGE
ncbi:MAG: 1-acyl-sn-glycerol-3-phosphate acyltransferase [Bacilli bacterium]|nr:1-acyl-sn-glycerol-3-phosphate acyltransferase [Bacilli bacterium]